MFLLEQLSNKESQINLDTLIRDANYDPHATGGTIANLAIYDPRDDNPNISNDERHSKIQDLIAALNIIMQPKLLSELLVLDLLQIYQNISDNDCFQGAAERNKWKMQVSTIIAENSLADAERHTHLEYLFLLLDNSDENLAVGASLAIGKIATSYKMPKTISNEILETLTTFANAKEHKKYITTPAIGIIMGAKGSDDPDLAAEAYSLLLEYSNDGDEAAIAFAHGAECSDQELHIRCLLQLGYLSSLGNAEAEKQITLLRHKLGAFDLGNKIISVNRYCKDTTAITEEERNAVVDALLPPLQENDRNHISNFYQDKIADALSNGAAADDVVRAMYRKIMMNERL